MLPTPKAACFIALLLIGCFANAQQRYANTLLWRISGRGLAKPSYLYGTMHLNDKRIFNFGDSVYKAIEACEGLAIELNPDEMAMYFANKMFDELENQTSLKDVLSEEDFKKYSTGLSKKFGKPADKISTSDVLKEKNQWLSDMMTKGEMPTFVDAFLYNIARRQGKWLGGIEDMSDQAGIMEDMVDKTDIEYLLANDQASISRESDSTVERMKTMYIAENISGIDTYSSSGAIEERDLILIRRNIKMARRMDSLIALRTMFLAVGAAHLPGDSGVIELLRKRGFKVDPVLSSKKIAASNYKFKEVHLPWVETKDPNDLYSISMPANPADTRLKGLVDVKFLLDIFTMSSFWTMVFPVPEKSLTSEKMLDEMAKEVFNDKNIKAVKQVEKNGVKGKEYIEKKDGVFMRLQIYGHEKLMYMTMMTAYKKEFLQNENSEKFFTSFQINKNSAAAKGEYRFTDSIMGISFTAPFKMERTSVGGDMPEGWKISSFSGKDMKAGIYTMLFSREVVADYFISSDSTLHDEFRKNLGSQYTILKSEEKLVQGQKLQEVIATNIKQPGIYAKVFFTVKNGRSIVFFFISDSATLFSPGTAKVFNSIGFIRKQSTEWSVNHHPDKGFSTWSPGSMRINISENNTHFFSYDTTTSTTYFVSPDTLSKYTWTTSIDSFWNEKVEQAKGAAILKKSTRVRNGEVSGQEAVFKLEESGDTYCRMRWLLNGNIIYRLTACGSNELLSETNTDKFFTEFRLSDPKKDQSFILQPKTSMILKDLLSKDSVERAEARGQLSSARFSEKDLEQLQEALFKTYEDPYGEGMSQTVNYEIAQNIADIGNASSIGFLKESYRSFIDKDETAKKIVLVTLSKMHTAESYSTIGELIKQSAPKEELGYRFGAGLSDSLALTAQLYPALQTLVSDTAQARLLAYISNELIDSNYLSRDAVLKYEKDFVRAAELVLPKIKTEDDVYQFSYIYQLVELLGRLNTNASNKTLRNWLSVKEIYLRKQIAVNLIRNKQTVSPAILSGIAADKYNRIEFYNELKEIKMTRLYPKEFLIQSRFAESEMYTSASEDDSPAKLEFLSKKTGVFKGKTYSFYLYKVTYNSEDEVAAYLGIAGGYDVAGKLLEPKEYLTGLYWQESFDKAKISAFFKKYLSTLEEDAVQQE
jgi:uncharacterized protein YbaP (TraB family)